MTESRGQDPAVALERLRRRFDATLSGTFAFLERAASQLESQPDDAATLESLRRELHRVHGTAGTFGYREASHAAARAEQMVIDWTSDHARRAERARMLREAIAQLRAAFGPPAAQAGDEPAGAPAAEPDAAPGGDADVVIVEDDTVLADMIRFALESAGLRALVYHDGLDAMRGVLSLPRRSQARLLVLDVDLPGMDGHSLHERVRLERPAEFAVVFVSARGGESEQLRGLRGGALDYLPKPVSLPLLLTKVKNWLPMLRRE